MSEIMVDCPHCGEPFRTIYFDPKGRKRQRYTCGKMECLNAARTKQFEARREGHPIGYCPHCGKLIERREGETYSAWCRRRTCGGSDCLAVAHRHALEHGRSVKPRR